LAAYATPTTDSPHRNTLGFDPVLPGDLVPNEFSSYPVRYVDGTTQVGGTDLGSDGFGTPWGQTRTWSNASNYTAGSSMGNGWLSSGQPYLYKDAATLTFVRDATTAAIYDGQGTPDADGNYPTYTPRFTDVQTIAYDSTHDEFVLADGYGDQERFYGFGSSYPTAQQGTFESFTDPGGNPTEVVAHDTAGHPTEVQRAVTVGGVTTTESYLSAYLPGTDPNAGMLASVTLRRKIGGGAWGTVQEVDYDYYDGTTGNGNLGDLERATVKDAGGNVLSESYYRYYTSSSSTGYQHGMSYEFGPVSYAKLRAAVGGTDADVDAASNGAVSPYADHYFEYDGSRRVTLETVAGTGDSATAGGLGTFTYVYTTSSNAAGYNSWHTKVVETLPSGATDTVYTNAYAEVMLAAFAESGGTGQWIDFYRYDGTSSGDGGHLVLHASPSAVTGYDDTYADLVDYSSGNAAYLSDTAGLVEVYAYASSTTATGTTSGDVADYPTSRAVRQGETGTDIPQEAWTYYERSAGGGTKVVLATDTVYRNDDGTGGQTKSFSFTWYSGTTQPSGVTETLPAVTTAENGSNTSTSETETYDIYGHPVWVMDQGGFLTYTATDPVTGAVTKTITDVDTTQTSTFTGLPSGWGTPTGGGLHLTTIFEADPLGRPTKETYPNGRVDYWVYDDPNHEIRYYPGWNTSTNSPTGPTQVTREDWANGYSETLTMSATPTVSSGRPTGAESIGSLQSLSRGYLNAGGQVIYTDDYFYLGGLTYSTSTTLGTSGTNFYRTTFGYDADGNLDRTESPEGTIYRTVFDGQGRKVSKWVGTDDTPTSGDWSPTNTTGTNLVDVRDYEYDGGGVGDGNLTTLTEHPGLGTADWVTEYRYDWRDRLVRTKAGVETTESGAVNRPLTVYDYDNLGEITRTRVYDGDGVGIDDPVLGELAFGLGSSSAPVTVAAVAADAAGNVYLAGSFSGTADFDPGAGTTSLSASSGELFVAKYTSAGALVWVRQGGGTGGIAALAGLAVDGSGDVVAVGSFTATAAFGGTTLTLTSGSSQDGFVWELDSSGANAWLAQAGGSGAAVHPAGVVATAAGDVYVVGSFAGSAGFGGTGESAAGTLDAFVWAIGSSGSTSWVTTAGGTGAYVTATGVAVDGSGDVVAVGSFDATTSFGGASLTPTSGDGYVWELNSAGATAWVADSVGGNGWVVLTGVAADAAGNVYAVGEFGGTSATFGGTTIAGSGGSQDGFVWKLDTAGATAWALDVGCPSFSVFVNGVTVDGSGDVFVAGSSLDPTTFAGVGGMTVSPAVRSTFVWKLDGAGATDGLTVTGGTGGSTAAGVAMGASGEVYVGGLFGGSVSFGGAVLTTTGSAGYGWQAATRLRAESRTYYDELGRVYRAETYNVDTIGEVGANPLHTDTWYDSRGNVIKQAAPGGLVTKTAYDGAGRATAEYETDGGGDAGYADADDVTGDKVLDQTEYAYDGNGNVLTTTTRQRFHDATGTGALGTPSSGVHARVYYTGSYYDLADRPTADVDVGTNGGTAWTRPSSVPTRSDTVLVTSYAYTGAGYVLDAMDPMGITTRTVYDALGRVTSTDENYYNGVTTDAHDKTTTYTYNAVGVTSLTAGLAGSAAETTAWVYGVTQSGGNGLDSNDIVGATQWPNKSTGAASSSEQDTETVNALGQVVTATDRNGTTHTYTYDVLGRVVADAVTTLGSGVDGSVRRIEYAYNPLGLVSLVTSYDAASGGSVVNQVKRGYNGLGQLVLEWQEHAGVVTSATPLIRYSYSEMAGGANHSRLTSITYPDGYVVTYNYATGLDDAVSRLSSVSEGTSALESYSYLGVDTVVVRSHPQPGVDLTYVKQSGESDGAAGDQYNGLDQFGRVVDQRWIKTSTGTATDRFQYGYDRDGNVLFRDNLVDTAFGELYGYDGFNQLTSFARGTLNSTKTAITGTAARTQGWDYDPVGNWDSVTTNGTTQTRSANAQNQYTAVGSATPGYDAAGNLTTDETGRQFVYDAWNRLVAVKNLSGTTLETFAYDGLGRRVSVSDAGTSTTTDLYYSKDWQVVEEGVGGVYNTRYVWSPVYVDATVLRDTDTSGTGLTAAGTGYSRLWVQQDANWNVTALVDASGAVVERYTYDPFGAVTVYDGSYTLRSGGSAYDWKHFWQGLRYDAASGTYNARARDISPTLGRPLQSDPLGYGAGDVNLYRWEGNTPATVTDPSGMAVHLLGYIQRFLKDNGLPDTPDNRAAALTQLDIERAGALRTVQGFWGPKDVDILDDPNPKIYGVVGDARTREGALAASAQGTLDAFQKMGEQVAADAIGKYVAGPLVGVVANAVINGGWKLYRMANGQLALIKGKTVCIINGTGCFASGTPLLTPDGWKPIEDFRPGDQILTRDEGDPSGPVVAGLVEDVYRRYTRVMTVSVRGQQLTLTEEHPFYTLREGWTPARRLVPGDLVLGLEGKWAEVESVTDIGRDEVVYNMTVAAAHTFFVGCDEWGFSVWAHNANGACAGKMPRQDRFPSRDPSGRIHGEIPSSVPRNWRRGEIQDAIAEAEGSLARRQGNSAIFGPDRGHDVRYVEEMNWLRQLQRRLAELPP
jgi:RHS repeat-associated protein